MKPTAPSTETRPIQPYRDARAMDQEDALASSAPRALTGLLAAAMQSMGDVENSAVPVAGLQVLPSSGE